MFERLLKELDIVAYTALQLTSMYKIKWSGIQPITFEVIDLK